jgi:hypothetical protein
MKPSRVQQAIKILNESVEASNADLKTGTKTRPQKKANSKPQPKKLKI